VVHAVQAHALGWYRDRRCLDVCGLGGKLLRRSALLSVYTAGDV
jgi:hypothetical protein